MHKVRIRFYALKGRVEDENGCRWRLFEIVYKEGVLCAHRSCALEAKFLVEIFRARPHSKDLSRINQSMLLDSDLEGLPWIDKA